MKKICTITCHDVYNAGASLQAYALMSYLNSTGNDATIIDYKPSYLSRHYYLWAVNPKFNKNIATRLVYYILKVPGRVLKLFSKRKLQYDSFKKKYLNVTTIRYSSNEQLKNQLPDADVFIAGSDQIWNPVLENGKDPSFYLDFVPDDKTKVAYAASFSVDEFPQELKREISGYLNRFDAISVRESSALKILKDMSVNNGINVVDPVFLLDSDKWSNICQMSFKDKYVLVYDFDNNQKIKQTAQNIAKEKGLKIYSVLQCDWADKSFENYGPDCFVSLVKNAQFVVSNSFHATAFSIIYKVPFFVFNREWGINTRMRDLVDMCNINYRLVDDVQSYDDNIDWQQVSASINTKIDISKNFLNTVIL